jgi:hypothetical protein
MKHLIQEYCIGRAILKIFSHKVLTCCFNWTFSYGEREGISGKTGEKYI